MVKLIIVRQRDADDNLTGVIVANDDAVAHYVEQLRIADTGKLFTIDVQGSDNVSDVVEAIADLNEEIDNFGQNG